MEQTNEVTQFLAELIRVSSRLNLAACTGIEPQIKEFKVQKLTSGYHKAKALLRSEVMDLTINIYFQLEEARFLAAKGIRSGNDEVSDETARDFVKELCNISLGSVKEHFVEHQSEEVSAFESMAPEDSSITSDVDFEEEKKSGQIHDYFTLKFKKGELVVSTIVKINDPEKAEGIEVVDPLSLNVNAEGYVDFL